MSNTILFNERTFRKWQCDVTAFFSGWATEAPTSTKFFQIWSPTTSTYALGRLLSHAFFATEQIPNFSSSVYCQRMFKTRFRRCSRRQPTLMTHFPVTPVNHFASYAKIPIMKSEKHASCCVKNVFRTKFTWSSSHSSALAASLLLMSSRICKLTW